MTDRIRTEFEQWATGREFPDLTQSMGRYNRAVFRVIGRARKVVQLDLFGEAA